jgi:hypothetical protein
MFFRILIALPLTLLAKDAHAKLQPFLQIQEGLFCPNLLHVQFVDLEFWLLATEEELSIQDGRMLMVHLIAPPKQFFLRQRQDLIVPIEITLESSQGRDSAVAQLLASWFLPNIDDQRAANLSLSLSGRRGPSRRWTLGLYGVPPKPVDATTPTAWARHIGDPEVLSTIAKKLDNEVRDENGIPWSLALLGNSNSPAAMKELRGFFERHPDKMALGAEEVLGAEYLARGPWDYLRSHIFPIIFKNITVDDGHWSLLIWYGFYLTLDMKQPLRIEGGSWNEIRPIAEEFLDHLLTHPGFDRVIVGGDYKKVPDSVTPLMMAEACDEYETVLEICSSFGVSDQVDDLNRAMATYEKVLGNPKMSSEWPLGRGGSMSGPRYEEAFASFKKLKKEAVDSMRARSRSS